MATVRTDTARLVDVPGSNRNIHTQHLAGVLLGVSEVHPISGSPVVDPFRVRECPVLVPQHQRSGVSVLCLLGSCLEPLETPQNTLKDLYGTFVLRPLEFILRVGSVIRVVVSVDLSP